MRFFILSSIRFYQVFLSFILRSFCPVPLGCKFWPTCSDYTHQTIVQYGVRKGLIKGLRRLLHCHPWS